ncbi:MAG TPA: sigma-54-dependent Fis family transcriptional regulator [Syntrophus sp. (in: bacteria)]|nr:sigma-54-dependent Fis family transcriptional regulator [Syntrophus sp. (in: bacteria)]
MNAQRDMLYYKMVKHIMKILVADSDAESRKTLKKELDSLEGISADVAATGAKALSMLKGNDYDIAALDLGMPGLDGPSVIQAAGDAELPCDVIVLTPHETVQTARECLQLGAYAYAVRPIKIEKLFLLIQRIAEKRALVRENLRLKEILKRQAQFPNIVTQAPVMLELLETMRRIAPSGVPVHIFGESGVGKELVALGIHSASERAGQPFIALNCAAITESMFESELFGHEKGAFTGAQAQKPGLLEIASGGTLFIDEVGEMPMQTQVKLLRVLETGVFYRVGGVREITVDFRLVSASNKDLIKEAERGGFRKDLYWRIGGMTLQVPPLREHLEDIPLLVQHFFKMYPSFRAKSLSPASFLLLARYGWPGNVRELFHMVHRACLLSRKNVLEPSDFPGLLPVNAEPAASLRMEDMERDHILRIMKITDGHQRKAAEILGISIKTLYRKLLKYGIPKPPE